MCQGTRRQRVLPGVVIPQEVVSVITTTPGSGPVVYISTYPPRRCGIATYTSHLAAVVSATRMVGPARVVAIEETGSRRTYPPAVIEVVPQEDPAGYVRAAEKVNHSRAALVSLQHEYGIFGGEAGEYVLNLIRRLHAPVVATLHTVLARPEPPYRQVLEEISRLASTLVVMSRAAREILHSVYGVDPRRVAVIPHGAPLPDPKRRRAVRPGPEDGPGVDAEGVGQQGGAGQPVGDGAAAAQGARQAVDHAQAGAAEAEPALQGRQGQVVPRRPQVGRASCRERV